MESSKRILLSTIGVAILIVLITGVTFAFFNYTRTGVSNTIRVGRIYFNTTQDNTINLTNVFPTNSNNLDNTNSATVTVNITGDTEYSEGIEYKVSIVDVQNVVGNQELPISFSVEATDLGTESNDYYNDRGSTTNVYSLVESGLASNDEMILVGYIKSDNVGIDGSIDITAYIDEDEVGISDTVSRIENGNLVYGETSAEWIDGRTILTTTEWNGLQTDGVSFKIKIEANEGIWVEEPRFLVMKNLHLANDTNWTGVRANITSVEFNTTGVAPENAISSFDATDLSSEGPVTVYILDDGLGNSTYKAVIVADGEIYAPENSQGLFRNMTNLVTFDSTNFKVDLATTLHTFFANDNNLANIDTVSSWNTSNVQSFRSMFQADSYLTNINALRNWDTSNVTTMYNMFRGCGFADVDGLINWDTSNVTDMSYVFQECANLENINGLVNWNVSNVEMMPSLFGSCVSLENVDGLLNWKTPSLRYMQGFVDRTSSLKSIDLSSFDMSMVTFTQTMFQLSGVETIKLPNNYIVLSDYMFNHASSYNGESFTIPKTVIYAGYTHIFYDFGKDNVFKKFIVEDGSTSFKTIDDILYTYDGTRLIAVPRGQVFTNNTYEIPEGITFSNELSFSRNKNIDTVILPNSYVIERYIVANNNSYGFSNSGNSLSIAIYLYTGIKSYEVKNDNPRYTSDSGCIYSKDGSELIAVPLHYEDVLNIKSGTTTIGQEAFWTDTYGPSDFDNLTGINIPASVTTIEANQLTLLNSLMRRSTNPVTITIDSGNTAYQITNNQIVAK